MWISADGEATTSGARSLCPACVKPVVAKCGPIVPWHWSHLADEDCDHWSEPETRWHRDWKSAAPPERREVIVENHRADIVSARGYVVEVQHSTISYDEINERDRFYGERFRGVYWILDATGAKEPRFQKNWCWRCDSKFILGKKRHQQRVWSCLDCSYSTTTCPGSNYCPECRIFSLRAAPCVCATLRSKSTGSFRLRTRPSFFLVADEGRLLLDYGKNVLVIHAIDSECENNGTWTGWGSLIPSELVRQRLAEPSHVGSLDPGSSRLLVSAAPVDGLAAQ